MTDTNSNIFEIDTDNREDFFDRTGRDTEGLAEMIDIIIQSLASDHSRVVSVKLNLDTSCFVNIVMKSESDVGKLVGKGGVNIESVARIIQAQQGYVMHRDVTFLVSSENSQRAPYCKTFKIPPKNLPSYN